MPTSSQLVTASLAASKPNDVVLSPDGTRIYAARSDGFLRVYDVETGKLIHTWDVGTRLGGIDISADGSYLIAVDLEPVSAVFAEDPRNNQFQFVTHRVDLATGQVTDYPVALTGYEYGFWDAAILSNGSVLLTGRVVPGPPGTMPARILDL
ncbi:MAG TPA: hypothetical protein VGB65_10340, partial [Allosphingosinicella sp.]